MLNSPEDFYSPVLADHCDPEAITLGKKVDQFLAVSGELTASEFFPKILRFRSGLLTLRDHLLPEEMARTAVTWGERLVLYILKAPRTKVLMFERGDWENDLRQIFSANEPTQAPPQN